MPTQEGTAHVNIGRLEDMGHDEVVKLGMAAQHKIFQRLSKSLGAIPEIELQLRLS